MRLCRLRRDWLLLGWQRRFTLGSRCGSNCGARSIFNRVSSHIHSDEEASGAEDGGHDGKPPQRSSPYRKFRPLKSDRAVEVGNKGAGQTQHGPDAKYHHRICNCLFRWVLSNEGKKNHCANAVQQDDECERAAGILVPLSFDIELVGRQCHVNCPVTASIRIIHQR